MDNPEQRRYGLTGGIGSGKSSVSAILAEHGATIIDADQIVRDLQTPQSEVLEHMAEILDRDILKPDGSLNRALAAQRIFSDDTKRQAVQDMMAPFIWTEVSRQLKSATNDEPVVLDVPLLIEARDQIPATLHGIIVVDTPKDLAIDRLARFRNISAAEAELRMRRQTTRKERLAHADFVIRNNSSKEHLHDQTLAALQWMKS